MNPGLETLDLALIHEQALSHALETSSGGTSLSHATITRRSQKFFSNANLPIEATQHAALEAHDPLIQLKQDLKLRSQDLVSVKRKLKKEIAHRKAAEKSLIKSEKESANILKKSRELQEQMRLLSRRVLTAQEEERKRISRELHDVIGQMLAGINVGLSTLKTPAAANTRGLDRKISQTQRVVEESVRVVHRFARELRPAMLDDLGLIPALHTYLKEFSNDTGIRVTLTAFAGVEKTNSALRTTLYRVAQEALTNVTLHAEASRVNVIIEKLPGIVCMQIKDDGKSFNVDRMWHVKKSQRLGMLGMRERLEMVNGTFTVESSHGVGTTVYARIPFTNKPKEGTHK